MRIDSFLRQATDRLLSSGITTGRLDCLILLEDELKQNRAHLLAHPEGKIRLPSLLRLNKKIAQRTKHTPLAYIRGKVMFYGREFIINDRVLVPRPETEAMIDLVKTLRLPAHPHIADVGTGSGCIGISIALELPQAKVDLYDISLGTLRVSRMNAKKHGAHVNLFRANLLARNTRPYHVVLANLPYVPDGYPINEAAKHEPAQALFGGPDGLDLYKQLWEQLALQKPPYVLIEALPEQHRRLTSLAKAAGYIRHRTDGYVQLFGTGSKKQTAKA